MPTDTAFPDESDEEIDTIWHVGSSNKPISVDVLLDNQPLRMELDTGATRSLISEATYKKLFKNRPMEHSAVRLSTYSGR